MNLKTFSIGGDMGGHLFIQSLVVFGIAVSSLSVRANREDKIDEVFQRQLNIPTEFRLKKGVGALHLKILEATAQRNQYQIEYSKKNDELIGLQKTFIKEVYSHLDHLTELSEKIRMIEDSFRRKKNGKRWFISLNAMEWYSYPTEKMFMEKASASVDDESIKQELLNVFKSPLLRKIRQFVGTYSMFLNSQEESKSYQRVRRLLGSQSSLQIEAVFVDWSRENRLSEEQYLVLELFKDSMSSALIHYLTSPSLIESRRGKSISIGAKLERIKEILSLDFYSVPKHQALSDKIEQLRLRTQGVDHQLALMQSHSLFFAAEMGLADLLDNIKKELRFYHNGISQLVELDQLAAMEELAGYLKDRSQLFMFHWKQVKRQLPSSSDFALLFQTNYLQDLQKNSTSGVAEIAPLSWINDQRVGLGVETSSELKDFYSDQGRFHLRLARLLIDEIYTNIKSFKDVYGGIEDHNSKMELTTEESLPKWLIKIAKMSQLQPGLLEKEVATYLRIPPIEGRPKDFGALNASVRFYGESVVNKISLLKQRFFEYPEFLVAIDKLPLPDQHKRDFQLTYVSLKSKCSANFY